MLQGLLNDVYATYGSFVPSLGDLSPPGNSLFGCLCGGTIAWSSVIDALFKPLIDHGDSLTYTPIASDTAAMLASVSFSDIGFCRGTCSELMADVATVANLMGRSKSPTPRHSRQNPDTWRHVSGSQARSRFPNPCSPQPSKLSIEHLTGAGDALVQFGQLSSRDVFSPSHPSLAPALATGLAVAAAVAALLAKPSLAPSLM